ncbi:4Fe-4S binding protein [Geomonas subterranea]|uniref:4Fe-4S binding protein n=1 Tax=Geomonas subterranea TaxID=2847989 RepID=UPI003461B67B
MSRPRPATAARAAARAPPSARWTPSRWTPTRGRPPSLTLPLRGRGCPTYSSSPGRGGREGGGRKARAATDFCLGCGICARVCPAGAVRLEPRARRILTPVNTAHRLVLMAIERGKLQNLIFDNQAYLSHRAMAAILGAILRMPPVKRLMASEQLKSRYLGRLLENVEVDRFSGCD